MAKLEYLKKENVLSILERIEYQVKFFNNLDELKKSVVDVIREARNEINGTRKRRKHQNRNKKRKSV